MCFPYLSAECLQGFARYSCLRDPVLIHRGGVLIWCRLKVHRKNYTISCFYTKWSMKDAGGDSESVISGGDSVLLLNKTAHECSCESRLTAIVSIALVQLWAVPAFLLSPWGCSKQFLGRNKLSHRHMSYKLYHAILQQDKKIVPHPFYLLIWTSP